MNLLNQVVVHKRFGEGKIIALEGKEDAELQAEIEGLISEKKAAKARMKAEAHEAKLRAIEEESILHYAVRHNFTAATPQLRFIISHSDASLINGIEIQSWCGATIEKEYETA